MPAAGVLMTIVMKSKLTCMFARCGKTRVPRGNTHLTGPEKKGCTAHLVPTPPRAHPTLTCLSAAQASRCWFGLNGSTRVPASYHPRPDWLWEVGKRATFRVQVTVERAGRRWVQVLVYQGQGARKPQDMAC